MLSIFITRLPGVYPFLVFLLMTLQVNADDIKHDKAEKQIILASDSGRLQLVIDYSKGCRVSQLTVNGRNTISPSGAYSSIKAGPDTFTSADSVVRPKISVRRNRLTLSNIIYGNQEITVAEKWIFTASDTNINWEINREYSSSCILDDMSMPVWNFTSTDTWKGGILNTGGVVWCKYLANVNDTYGVHTNGALFWQPTSGDGLNIVASNPGKDEMACSFRHSEEGEFSFTQYLTPGELAPRYNLSRFVSKKGDVFAPFTINAGVSSVVLSINYVDYNSMFDRGTLPGIDAVAVRELMNTTGRYGVVDRNIVGGNGWLTNWKCLHEPFFAQIGMAVNDINYIKNMASMLDQERDQAVESDGRVLARWHDVPEAENSNYDFKTGYYDCPWGYTIDAQPSQVINTVELFNQTGDIDWLKTHKQNCEKILNWLIKRDTDNDGLFEMLNDSTGQKKCSDWIDVVWASYENAFVNALMYEALNQWSECEKILGDAGRSEYYSRVAGRLKTSFNKSVEDGGFWSPAKKLYIYWRDKDGSIHGDNLVTPVNFAAIAFGICDDKERISQVLDQIEQRAVAENLFHWPLCYESFLKEEVYEPVNWPFPNYENGDIFPTWGYLGVRSYVKYRKDIALKYIKNILVQYNIDGLSSQRFSRREQKGVGSDILAGSCTTITALYSDIYGIKPKWNRFGLEPNLTAELNGTELNYTLRGKKYNIRLEENNYQVSSSDFTLSSGMSFGVSSDVNSLLYYPYNKDRMELSVSGNDSEPIKIDIEKWNDEIKEWVMISRGIFRFVLSGLKPESLYRLRSGNEEEKLVRTVADGSLIIDHACQDEVKFTLTE